MKFSDYLRLAFRNIRRQKLRSALTIFAVVIGALSVTIMLALVFSAKGFMTKQFEQSGLFQQVIVSPQTDIEWSDYSSGGNQCSGSCVKLTEKLIKKIDALPHVVGVSRNVHPFAFQYFTYGNQKPLRVQNVESHDVNGVQTTNIVAGREFKPSDGSGLIIITSDYADKLGYKNNYQALLGKTVSLTTQQFFTGEGSDPVKRYQEQSTFFSTHPGVDGRDFQPTPTILKAKIVGITDTMDSSYTIRVPLNWARGLSKDIQYQPAQQQCSFNQPCHNVPAKTTVTDELAKNGYDSLIVKADAASNAKTVAAEIKKLGVGASDAQTFINQQLAAFNIIGAVLGGIGGIALAVAAVGVVNTMIMAILERTREIGVMRAVGARRSTFSRLFTFEASLLGFFGGVVGLGIGYALTLIANPIVNKQLSSNGLIAKDIISLPPWLVIGVIIITTFIGMLAGLYPARRAAHLDPVEALHYE
jgi:putative ABC transport system permease protein